MHAVLQLCTIFYFLWDDVLPICHKFGFCVCCFWYIVFLPRDAMQVRSMLSRSVFCPSVRPSRSWITSKQINISSKFFHHRVANSSFSIPKGMPTFRQEPPNGGVECKGGMIKWGFFHKYLALCHKRIGRWAHAGKQFVSIEFSLHTYNI